MQITALLTFLVVFFVSLFAPTQTYAIEDPLSFPNNKVGIHILFPSELTDASALVNANGGDWGYVTIPIQAGDRDLAKWQTFMDQARVHHVIPLIRLATEGDYFNTIAWRKPTDADIVDFANFLNSLNWPTKNRYIIVFNEVNRGDEWGGAPNPSEYTEILQFAVDTFKSRNQDFFIISSGLDNAAANNTNQSYNEYTFMRAMHDANAKIFNAIDGLSSHSYPNPGFSQPSYRIGQMGIASFRYEENLAFTFSNKHLPVFITETGWRSDAVSDARIVSYYQDAFTSVWSDSDVVAVTPFLLRADAEPFHAFSFVNTDSSPTKEYSLLASLPKVKGAPTIFHPLSNSQLSSPGNQSPQTKHFSKSDSEPFQEIIVPDSVKALLKWLLKI